MPTKEQAVWSSLLTVSDRGVVCWANERTVTRSESRHDPLQFMAMCGNLRTLSEYDASFNTDSLKPTAEHSFEATKGEVTGLNGLLRLSNQFESPIKKPRSILLVGAMTPNSLLSLLKWCQKNDWGEAHITLVDKSPVPLHTLEAMRRHGYYSWPGGIDLVNTDILEYQHQERTDLIVADILNTWMVDEYHHPHLDRHSPYIDYNHFLNQVNCMLSKGGQFLSRCLIAPASGQHHSQKRSQSFIKKTSQSIIEQLSGLVESYNLEEIEESVASLFEASTPETFCGLSRVYPVYRATDALSGPHAAAIYERFHRRTFTNTELITVHDPRSGNTFQNYLCQG